MKVEHPMDVLGLGPENEREPVPIFDSICHDLVQNLSELEGCIEDLLRWKDDFTSQNIPGSVKLEISLLFSKLFRSKSDLHGPLFELVRQVMLYSRSWNVNREKLLALEKDYHEHYYVLDVAIRKIEALNNRISTNRTQHQLSLWERLANRILFHHANVAKQGSATDPNTEVNSVAPIVEKEQVSRNSTPAVAVKAVSRQSESPQPKRSKPEPSAWDELRQNILESYLEEPEWRKTTRLRLRQFRKTLQQHFSGVTGIIQELIRRPLPSIAPKIEYLSQRSGTIRYHHKPFPKARALSIPDLSIFYKRNETARAFQEWLEAEEKAVEVDMYGVPLHQGDEKPPNPLLKRVRSNSTSILFDLGTNVQLSSAFEMNTEINGGRVPLDAQSDTESEAESNYTEKDERAFKALLKDKKIQENLTKFLQDQTKEETARENNLDELEKETFDLQDVMELTLLHAQQLQVMKQTFEEQEKDWKIQLDQALSKKDEEIEQLLQKIDDLNKEKEDILSQRVPIIAEPILEDSESIPRVTRNKSIVPDRFKSTSSLSIAKPSREPSMAQLGKIHPVPQKVKSSTSVKQSKTDLSKQKQYVQNHKRAPFESTPFKLGFFERLEWFTEMSQKYHQEQRNKALEKERRVNEQKLAHLKLLREATPMEEQLPQVIPAEFMPMPGSVPPSKNKDLITLSEHGNLGS
jgi:hypothetical protein